MHIIVVSACEKKALRRTRAVVDSYAVRTGPRSWATPITEEGLVELRAALKRGATRQTAVACYRNDGRRAMRLLWIVGARGRFGPHGHFPAGHTRVPRRARPVARWVRVAALLAKGAGLAHDWGKAIGFFQDKLRQADGLPQRDPVRHEWVSLGLLEATIRGASHDDAWEEALPGGTRTGKRQWFRGLTQWQHVLFYLVATHHKLFAGNGNVLGNGNHVRTAGEGVRPVDAQGYRPRAAIPESLRQSFARTVGRIARLPEAEREDAHFWRAVATITRACLVLADQAVSARDLTGQGQAAPAGLYANTRTGRLNQPLDWHLREVGHLAGDLVHRLASMSLDGLSEGAIERALEPSADARFAWQDGAADVMRACAQERALPTLVVNLAGTGSGKTRMNAKAVCALNPSRSVRFVTALNLRTLTLQTGDAYRDEIGIDRDEMSVVIGDRAVRSLHVHARAQMDSGQGPEGETVEDEDGNAGVDYEMEVAGEPAGLPRWLQELVATRPGAAEMLAPPVLVSTVDTIVKAGEPDFQGHHAVQLLRLADSDLILDELDGYDPPALVACLRLVTLCAMFGRHVIVSSATLPRPVVRALAEAYHLGIQMHGALNAVEDDRPARWRSVFIDDSLPPAAQEHAVTDDGWLEAMEQGFDARVAQWRTQPPRCEKRPMLQEVQAGGGEAALFDSVAHAARRLHESNHLVLDLSGMARRVSFGLVRCANIHTAVPLARALARALPEARVACYHAQDFLIARYHKERRLDELLRRARGDDHIASDPEVRAIASASPGEDVLFVVVATPVEEVGRDHDFDWAVLEPSSSHSIIQAAGRVNRHRRQPRTQPNIAVLQRNARSLRGATQGGAVFCRPGLEPERREHLYASHDLADLFDWEALDEIGPTVRYDPRHRFTIEDDNALRNELEHRSRPLQQFLATGRGLWMGEGIYSAARLREHKAQERLLLSEDGQLWREERERGEVRRVRVHMGPAQIETRVENDWLTLNTQEMLSLADEAGIDPHRALAVDVRAPRRDPDENEKERIVWDQSFGWWHVPRARGETP